jgi:hypothetical protein
VTENSSFTVEVQNNDTITMLKTVIAEKRECDSNKIVLWQPISDYKCLEDDQKVKILKGDRLNMYLSDCDLKNGVLE